MQRAHEIGIADVTIENQWAPYQIQAFDSRFRFSAILHHYDDTATLYVKGAFEEIIAKARALDMDEVKSQLAEQESAAQDAAEKDQ